MKKSHESVVGAALRVRNSRTEREPTDRPTDRPTGDASADADLPSQNDRRRPNETKQNGKKFVRWGLLLLI